MVNIVIRPGLLYCKCECRKTTFILEQLLYFEFEKDHDFPIQALIPDSTDYQFKIDTGEAGIRKLLKSLFANPHFIIIV